MARIALDHSPALGIPNVIVQYRNIPEYGLDWRGRIRYARLHIRKYLHLAYFRLKESFNASFPW